MYQPRRPRTLAFTVACLAGVLGAQQQNFVVPTAPLRLLPEYMPFAQVPMRYQQIYRGSDLAAALKAKKLSVARLQGVRFRTNSQTTGNTGYQVTLEAYLAVFKGTVSSKFNDNLVNPTQVFQGSITLPSTASPGKWEINLPFKQEFIYDGQSDLILEIRIISNGNQNKQFFFFCDGVLSTNTVETLAAFTGPTSTTATFRQSGKGLITRFDFDTGLAVPYGKGCVGEGNAIPEISSTGLPKIPTLSFKVVVDKAAANSPALLLWGVSNTQWGPLTLPLDMRPLLVPGCFLLASPDFDPLTAITTNAQPGTARAEVQFIIPPLTFLKNVTLYAQWAILDASVKPKRPLNLTMSNGLAITIG